MLELLEKDVPIGSQIKLYLVSGETISGVLEEVGPSFIIVKDDASKKRFFEPMIGGWDIIKKVTAANEEIVDSRKSEAPNEPAWGNHTDPVQSLTSAFVDALSEEELSYFFVPNARIISADKKNVVIRADNMDDLFTVPYKYIASKGILSDIDSYFLSGEESKKTSIPVYAGFYYKDRTPLTPNIVLEPGTMREYCSLLSEYLTPSNNSHTLLAKNLLFFLWRGCKTKKAKDAHRSLQSALRTVSERDVLREIDEQIMRYSERGQEINHLLNRKAQLLSSKNRYQEAINTYALLIDRLSKKEGSSPQYISHNYTQLALLQMRVKDFDSARASINTAIEYNPDNVSAQNVLKKLDSPEEEVDVEIETLLTPIQRIQEYTDSVLLDDLYRHTFTDPEARSNDEMMTAMVAERLLSQAESEDSQSAYLEAAKAYSLMHLSDDEDISNYAKAMYGYATSRSRVLYNFLINKNHLLGIKDLIKLADGSYCYFVSSINFGSILGQSWSTQFRDYLRMRLFCFASQHEIQNATELFELPLDEFVNKNRLENNIDFLIECSEVVISLGARCPIIKDNLHGDMGQSAATILELLNSFTQKELFAKQIGQAKKCPHIKFNGSAEQFIIQHIEHRVKKLANLRTRINFIKNKSTESLFEASIAPAFKRLRKSSAFLTATDLELSVEAEKMMGTLSIFKSRTPDERRILAPSIKSEISNILDSISGYSSYLCSDLLRDLWNRILKSKYLSVNEASSALQSELRVSSDGNIIIHANGSHVIPISVSNEGRSTIDKFRAIISFSEVKDNTFEYTGRHLSPGEAISVLVEIPETIKNQFAYDFTVEISGLIINTWSSSKRFSLTASSAAGVSFKLSDIKWNYQAKETREGMFKGRNTDIEKLINTFTTEERCKIPIVFGLTRTGKSSILLNLQTTLYSRSTNIQGKQYTILPIYLDLSTLPSQYKDHSSFMTQLILKCKKDFQKADLNILEYELDSMFEIIELANFHNIYPVFLLDEFSYVKPVIRIEGIEFLKSIREYAIDQKAGFVYAGTYDILDIIRDPELNPSGTFMNIDEYKIYNLKDQKDAEALMRVMEPQLSFTEPAINAIHDYSGDVPYWIQLICKHCALYAIKYLRPVIGMKELEDVIRGILGEGAVKGIDKISDTIFEQQQLLKSDPKETKALLYSIAYLMKDASNKDGVSWSRLKEFWNENSYKPDMDSIIKAKERLEDRLGLLSKEVDGTRMYRFSVGLFRRWCSKKDVFSEFDRTNN